MNTKIKTEYAIENGHAGWYVIIHYSMDDMELFGPFAATKEEADEELEYILSK